MKLLPLGLFLFLSISTFAQNKDSITEVLDYHSNGELQLQGKSYKDLFIDTVYTYDLKGKLKSTFIYGEPKLPRTVIVQEKLKGSGAKKLIGTYLQTGSTIIKEDGLWLYFRGNGSLIDSVIYKNGQEIYRARLNKKGKILFEEE